MVAAIIKGKEDFGGGWVCWKKKDGCGSKFDDDDPRILSQSVDRVENPDQYDLDNTVLKISKKRAYVDATLTAHAASGLFTQDIGDDDDNKGDDPPPPGDGGKAPARGGRGNQPKSDQNPPAPKQDVRPITQAQFKMAYAIGKRVGTEDIKPVMSAYEVICDTLAAAEIPIPPEEDRKNYGKLMKHVCCHLERYRFDGFVKTLDRYRGPEVGFLDRAAFERERAAKAEGHENEGADKDFENQHYEPPNGDDPEQRPLGIGGENE